MPCISSVVYMVHIGILKYLNNVLIIFCHSTPHVQLLLWVQKACQGREGPSGAIPVVNTYYLSLSKNWAWLKGKLRHRKPTDKSEYSHLDCAIFEQNLGLVYLLFSLFLWVGPNLNIRNKEQILSLLGN